MFGYIFVKVSWTINFCSKNQFYNQKLQVLTSTSRINSAGKIISTQKQPNMSESILAPLQVEPNIHIIHKIILFVWLCISFSNDLWIQIAPFYAWALR